MLGYMKLYDPAVERARELLADRPAPRGVDVTVLHPPDAPQLAHAGAAAPRDRRRPRAARPARRGRRRDRSSARSGTCRPRSAACTASVILGSIVHDLAVIRYLVGGPLTVEFADAWEHSVALDARLPGGARVTIRWHYLERYPAYREEVRVHDDDGTVALAFPAPYLLHAPTVLTVVDGGRRRASGAASRAGRRRRSSASGSRSRTSRRGGAAPRAGIAEGREDVVACQAAAALLAARQGINVGGEAAGGGT